ALEHKTCHENWAHPTLPLADAKDAFLPKETRVKLMTWNACSLSFPLRIHPAKLLLGIFLGFWWHDPQRDVPLQVRSRAARERCQRQAEYIRQSGADLIMLQEMLSTTMLETLMCHLASDFDCAYLTCRPTLSAVLLWTLFLLTVAFWQCALLQICLMVWSTSALGFCERWLMLAIWLALRSRGAVPFHFLCGDVAGQLVVLRRQTSRLEACVAKEFQAFDALGHQLLARSWLCVFFNVRPRGILRVTVPLGPRMGSLTLLNTHLPHNSDNSKLLPCRRATVRRLVPARSPRGLQPTAPHRASAAAEALAGCWAGADGWFGGAALHLGLAAALDSSQPGHSTDHAAGLHFPEVARRGLSV
ncbi:unnamed protein product, partial [Effrenium voratum]